MTSILRPRDTDFERELSHAALAQGGAAQKKADDVAHKAAELAAKAAADAKAAAEALAT